jgi:hypothetical protein
MENLALFRNALVGDALNADLDAYGIANPRGGRPQRGTAKLDVLVRPPRLGTTPVVALPGTGIVVRVEWYDETSLCRGRCSDRVASRMTGSLALYIFVGGCGAVLG